MSLTPAAAQTLRQALATVVVVPVTPLHADGTPDWDTYAALTRRVIDGGITVITPNGNTGEFYALSPAEARQATEAAALAGAAELTAPAYWACGAHGFTSGLANVTPELPLAMLDALRASDFGQAMKIWEKARRFEELRLADASADNVSVVKEALAQLGLCRADVRPPSRPLPGAIKDEIGAILASWSMK